jgi:hypothetical protein
VADVVVVEGAADVSIALPALLLVEQPSSSYILPVEESYFMFWRRSSSLSALES